MYPAQSAKGSLINRFPSGIGKESFVLGNEPRSGQQGSGLRFKGELAAFVQLHEIVRQAEGTDPQLSLCLLERIEHEAHTLGDALLE